MPHAATGPLGALFNDFFQIPTRRERMRERNRFLECLQLSPIQGAMWLVIEQFPQRDYKCMLRTCLVQLFEQWSEPGSITEARSDHGLLFQA